jgi:hypothetical protein
MAKRLRQATILLLALGLLAAAPAGAATRYASPTGGESEPCESSKPCTLAWAIEKAKANDEVIVEAGASPYTVGKEIQATVPLNVHGPTSGSLPEIDDAGASFNPMLSIAYESRLARLHLVGMMPQHPLLAASSNSTLEHLLLEGRAAKATLVQFYSSGVTLRDSVLTSPAGAEEMIGVYGSWVGGVSFLRNVTIELPGSGSIALRSEGKCLKVLPEEPTCLIFATPDFDVANAILRGGARDLEATSQAGWPGFIEISHSNYRSAKVFETTQGEITDRGGNQTTVEPSLTSDFHELAGSVTIDAGLADSHVGTQDPDGNARLLGAAPDIGAYEFIPPPSPLTATGGTTSTGGSPGSSTMNAPAPGRASASTARARRAGITQTLACAGQAGQTCTFTIRLTTTEHLKGKRLLAVTAGARSGRVRLRRVTVGAMTRSLSAGQVVTVKVALNATGRRLLARLHRLPITVRTATRDGAGKSVPLVSGKLTLRARATRRR